MTAPADTARTARIALSCLDLTSLNDSETDTDIKQLCTRAIGWPGRGPVAAVCVWPRRVRQVRDLLPPSIRVAAVANFPDGSADAQRVRREIGDIVNAGAQEVDLVLPYRTLDAAPALLALARQASQGLCLKVILETGELASADAIARASRIALEAGADFLKTSTGKTAVHATPEAARVMLESIARDPQARLRAGFKASGGIRRVADAEVYVDLVTQHLGPQALVPQRFRIGASALLDDIERTLGGHGIAETPGGY